MTPEEEAEIPPYRIYPMKWRKAGLYQRGKSGWMISLMLVVLV